MISKQQIKHIRSLQQKKFRNESDVYVAEGLKIVLEAVRQVPEDIDFICMTNKYTDLLIQGIIPQNIKTIEISVDEFKQITSLTTPQEILAILKKPKTILNSFTSKVDICMALDGIRDPGNLGTIIRLADWFGIRQIICSPDTVDCYNPKVVQATMGAILRVNLIYTELLHWLVDIKTKNQVNVYCAEMNGENLYNTELKKPAIIVLGNEANGISQEVIRLSDKNISIPNQSNYPDKSESLNVSIAAAVICAEFRRQTS